MAREPLSRFERACLAIVAAAFLVRLGFLLGPIVIWDSAWYLLLARSFAETGTFYLPWSEPGAPQYSGYWPPLFPIFAAPLVKLLGADYRVLVLASILASAMLTAAVFFTTRDLFPGRARAFAAAALVAANPAFYVSDSKGMSESLLALMVVLTVWAFLRSLERPPWLAAAAGFAFLAYLGKASLGLPIVVLGVAALAAWRVRTRGWRHVVRSPVDIAVAAAGLGAVALLAATRTGRLGGVGLGLIEPLRRGFLGADCGELVAQLAARPQWFTHTGPHCWAAAFPLKILFVAAFLFVVTLPLSLRLPDVLRQARTERTDALWLATLLPLVAGAVFTTTFFFTEHRTFVDFDNIRYLTPAMVPFIWLVLPAWSFGDDPAAKDAHHRARHARWFWLAAGALVALLLLNPAAGTQTLGRFRLLALLAFGAVALAQAARATHYALAERRVGGEVETRYVRAAAPEDATAPLVLTLAIFVALVSAANILGLSAMQTVVALLVVAAAGAGVYLLVKRGAVERGMLLLATAVLIGGGWFYSSWYVAIAFAIPVAFATPSPSRRFLAMALLLLASAAPGVHTSLPFEEAIDGLERLPHGTIVGLSEQVVFPAAVAPASVALRHVEPPAVPEGVDALLLQRPYIDEAAPAGFREVARWNYEFRLSPTLQARVWIERNVLGESVEFQQVDALALYVREGSAADAAYS